MYENLREKKPSIYILGSHGQLGKEFVDYLLKMGYRHVYSFDINKIDITNKHSIKDTLSPYIKKDDIVINCAAYNNVYGPETNDEEKREVEKKKCFKTNALGPKYLAKFCKKNNAKLVHFSTNYIFEDRRCTMKMYSEFDEVKPYLFYGFSKLCGENFIREIANHKFLILRTAWLFSRHGSLVKMIENQAKGSKELLVASAIGNPTYTLDVVKQTMVLLNNKMSGIYHCVSEGTVTKKKYIEEVVKNLQINGNKELNDLQIKDNCAGPSIPLKNFMLNMEGLNQMRSWKDALEDCFRRES